MVAARFCATRFVLWWTDLFLGKPHARSYDILLLVLEFRAWRADIYRCPSLPVFHIISFASLLQVKIYQSLLEPLMVDPGPEYYAAFGVPRPQVSFETFSPSLSPLSLPLSLQSWHLAHIRHTPGYLCKCSASCFLCVFIWYVYSHLYVHSHTSIGPDQNG